MEVLWLARFRNEYVYGGGHKMVGYCGWHQEETGAMQEAIRRYPNVDPSEMYVARV